MSETRTLTLSEFLLARIAEDEARVRGLHQGEGDPDFFWGPDRIRAECEAKRRIVELHPPRWAVLYSESERQAAVAEGRSTMPTLAHTSSPVPDPDLLALAAVYADHPDFREEWRVTSVATA